MVGLVGHDPDRAAIEPGEGGDDLRAEVGFELERRVPVDDPFDDVPDVVAAIWFLGDDRVDALGRLRRRSTRPCRQRGTGMIWQVPDELGDQLSGVGFVLGHEVRATGVTRVYLGATERLEVDVLAGHHLHHPRAGDGHRRHALDHDGEVGEDGGVRGTGDTGPIEHADLGNVPREQRVVVVVLPDPLAVGEKARLLVDPPTRGVHQVQHRPAAFERPVLHLEELLDTLRGHAPGLDGEVVRHHVEIATLEGGRSRQ